MDWNISGGNWPITVLKNSCSLTGLLCVPAYQLDFLSLHYELCTLAQVMVRISIFVVSFGFRKLATCISWAAFMAATSPTYVSLYMLKQSLLTTLVNVYAERGPVI
jgi:hypothetical protein